jgi:hypothetical protein
MHEELLAAIRAYRPRQRGSAEYRKLWRRLRVEEKIRLLQEGL